MSKYLSIAEIAELVDIPNSTCRRYLASFESFFLVKGGSRLKKYEISSVDILKRIKQLYDEGMDTTEIHSVLINEFPLVIESDKQQESNEQAHGSALATSEDILEIKEELQELKSFNVQLLQEMKNQHLYYEKKFEELKHDRELIGSLKNSMEQRKLESANHENKTTEQLQSIDKQLSEIRQHQNDNGTITEQIAELHNQFEQMKEAASSQEKKGFFARLFGK